MAFLATRLDTFKINICPDNVVLRLPVAESADAAVRYITAPLINVGMAAAPLIQQSMQTQTCNAGQIWPKSGMAAEQYTCWDAVSLTLTSLCQPAETITNAKPDCMT